MPVESFQSRISIIAGGNFCQIVQHWNIEDPSPGTAWETAKAFVDACSAPIAGDAYLDVLAAMMSVDCFISSVQCRREWPTPGATAVEVYAPSTHPGAFGTHTESASVAAVGVWITDDPENVTGRTFFPGIPQEAIDRGYWQGTWLAAWDNMLAVLVGTGVDSSVGDFRLAVKYAGVPPTWRSVVRGALSESPGTQRRRLMPY